jgi:hypothetical protein
MRFALAVLILGASILGCDSSSSDGGANDLATLSGTVTLEGAWPAEGEIQISLFSHWDTALSLSLAPGGPPSFYTEALTSPTPQGNLHLVNWELHDITPGDYPCLVVGWRNGGTMGVDEPVLGMFGADFAIGDTLPENLALQAGDDFEANFSGDLSLVPPANPVVDPGTVTGTVSFPGEWPTGYGSGVFIVAMESGDPATPSMPIGGAMQLVAEGSENFELTLPLNMEFFLAIYGYPYDMDDPFTDFFGGHGYDWESATPTLRSLGMDATVQPTLEDLEIVCREP